MCLVCGEVDLATADKMERSAAQAMDAHGPYLILDLCGVTFMDARGIAAMLRLREKALARGGHLRLTGVPPVVLRLLLLTKTNEELGVTAPSRVHPG